MKLFCKHFNTAFGFFLALFLFASLFWCGDQDCLNDNGSQSCSALFCILLGNHGSPDSGSSASSSDHCECVCNSLITFQDTVSLNVYHNGTAIYREYFYNPESPSLSTLYRPPIAV